MALPQKVIEQLGREPASTPGWSSRLLMFSSTVFFIALAIYLGITFGYRPYVESDVQKLKDQMESFSQEVPKDDQAKLFAFYGQINNLKTLLKNHVLSSQSIEWLEQDTQTNVFFSRFTFQNAKHVVILSGAARTIPDFIQQVQRFQRDPLVTRVSFQQLTFADRVGWQFDLALSVSSTAFTGSPVPTAASETLTPSQ